MFEKNFLLKQISHYKIGGEAKYFFEVKHLDQLISAVHQARKLKIPVFILAGATNVLIDDKGYKGLIIKPNFRFLERNGNQLRVGSGVFMNEVVDFSASHSLKGLEWAAGIPGTIGGAVRGNAGAFSGEMKDVIYSVISLDISSKIPKIIKRYAVDCLFNYRSSIFKKKKNKEIILEVILNFAKGDRNESFEKINSNINYRFSNHPMEHRSLGSVFKNVPLEKFSKKLIDLNKIPIKRDPFEVVPVAHLISEAGLKGVAMGGAMISPKHPNFIVNVLDAKSSDVKKLIELAKKEIKKKFKINLEEEIEHLS